MTRQRIVRPRINAKNPDLAAITEETWRAIHEVSSPPDLFLREGGLVLISYGAIRDVDTQLLRWYLTGKISFYQMGKDKAETAARPPNDLLQNMIVMPSRSLPGLRGITSIPTFALDGTLQSTPGYSPMTELLFVPLAGLEKA